MLVTLREVLSEAQKNQYGVGLFNTINLEMAKAVLEAAEQSKSPVIIGTAECFLDISTLQELAYFLIPMAKKSKVPVVVHLDHGLSEDAIKEALRLGFSSVMYDCSTDSYQNNIKRVANITKLVHQYGASIEAELGHVGANEHASEGHGEQDNSIYTDPLEAKHYIEQTGVDALAVAIGTAHGAYKSTPKLDINRLDQIAQVVKAPLVLHGGSGLSDTDFQNCIKHGVSKINIFTDINCAGLEAIHQLYVKGKGISDVAVAMKEAIREATLKKMLIFGSNNHA